MFYIIISVNFHNMLDLAFKGHTTEKLEIINYYYNPWFKIVGSIRDQKAYIIDCYAGTGYSIINDEKKLGSALLATKLFKNDINENLVLHLIQKNLEEYETLVQNIKDFIRSEDLRNKAIINNNIHIHRNDWSKKIEQILSDTNGGIRFILLDTDDVKSLSWNRTLPLVLLGKDEFGHKISGNELLINYPWFGIRRQLGVYFSEHLNLKKKRLNYNALDKFFPFNWRKIVNKYPPSIFDPKNRDTEKIKELSEELVKAYILKISKYFRYISIHSVRHRNKSDIKDILLPGDNFYYLIFASNHPKAPEIINKKFEEYINKPFYSKTQTSLNKFIYGEKRAPIQRTLTIHEKLRNLNVNLNKIEKDIIKYLYQQKNYDFGCYEFLLLRKLKLEKSDKALTHLIEEKIIQKINRRSKKGKNMKFYRLIHPKLVNRNNYLYFDKRIFLIEDGKLILKKKSKLRKLK